MRLIIMLMISAALLAQDSAIRAVMCPSSAVGGTGDAITCTPSPAVGAYADGMLVLLDPTAANTGAVTINISALGTKSVVKPAGGVTTALAANDIRSNQQVILRYDGTNFQMMSQLGNAATGESSAPDYKAAPLFIDDFAKGTFSSNNIGDMRWTLTNGTGASGAMIASTAGRPGLFQFGSGTTTTVINAPGLAGSLLYSSDTFDITLIFKLDHNDANTTFRAGLNCTGTYNSGNPNSGIYIEKEDADTSFYGVTFNGAGNESRTAALGSTDTSYHRFRIRRVDGSTVGFTMDASAEVTATTNIPTAACNMIFSISNSSGSGNKQFTADYVSIGLSGLTR